MIWSARNEDLFNDVEGLAHEDALVIARPDTRPQVDRCESGLLGDLPVRSGFERLVRLEAASGRGPPAVSIDGVDEPDQQEPIRLVHEEHPARPPRRWAQQPHSSSLGRAFHNECDVGTR